MEKSRRQQVNDALAINSLDSVPVDSEMMDLLDAYANHEIDYEEFSNKVDEKVRRDIENSEPSRYSLEENKKINDDLMTLINKTLNDDILNE